MEGEEMDAFFKDLDEKICNFVTDNVLYLNENTPDFIYCYSTFVVHSFCRLLLSLNYDKEAQEDLYNAIIKSIKPSMEGFEEAHKDNESITKLICTLMSKKAEDEEENL